MSECFWINDTKSRFTFIYNVYYGGHRSDETLVGRKVTEDGDRRFL